MKKRGLIFIMVAVIYNFSTAQNATVQNLLNDVRLDSLINYVKQLSGEKSVVINGVADTIKSRYYLNAGNEKAFLFVKQELLRYGYPVDSMSFSTTGKNLFAIKTGYKYPDKQFILGAHYDGLPGTQLAPGADDNASGIAAVLEAARVFSNYNFPFTIVFALWDEEELGLLGSKAYVQTISSGNKTFLGYINLDMIAWDGNNDSIAEINVKSVANSLALSNKANYCNTAYNIQLKIHTLNPGEISTDHAPFWDSNYSAIGIGEEHHTNFYPYWHTQADSLAQFNLSFFKKCAKLAYATLAEFATDTVNIVGVKELKSFPDIKVYPNPFLYSLTLNFGDNKTSLNKVSITDYLGRVLIEKETDSVSITLQIPDLQTGIYFLNIYTPDGVSVKKIVRY